RTMPSERHRSILVPIGFGVGAAGLVAGAITGVVSLSKTSSLKDQCPNGACPAIADDARSSANTFANISNVSFAIGGVGALVGVIGLLMGTSSDGAPVKSARVVVAPSVGPSSAGVLLSF